MGKVQKSSWNENIEVNRNWRRRITSPRSDSSSLISADLDILVPSTLLDYINEVRRYPASHRHLEEIPLDLKGLMECAKRNRALRNATSSKSTWGLARRGNMFID